LTADHLTGTRLTTPARETDHVLGGPASAPVVSLLRERFVDLVLTRIGKPLDFWEPEE